MHCQFVFRCSKAGVIAGSSQLLFPLGEQRKKSELRIFDEKARIGACNRFDRVPSVTPCHFTLRRAPLLIHFASHKNEIQQQHYCQQISQPADFAAAPAEHFDPRV
jgi:hypothetical protein